MARRAVLPLSLALAAGPALAQVPQQPPPVPPPAPGAVSAMTAQPCPPDRDPLTDWPSQCRYREANRAVDKASRAVFIGDSITEFWLRTAPGLFAAGVVDRGVSGQTCPQIMARFYQDAVRLRPRVVHIMCGTNDVAGNTGPTSPDDYANAVLAMVDMARANGIAVVIGSILPAGAFSWRVGYRPAPEIAALNAWLRDLAQQRGLVFADYYAAMAGPDGAMKPGLANDGVHPNAAGYAIMEPIARAALAEAERRARKP
ncbi:GDSL-type esterase/lipase family protein [Novosphingobium sp. Fuku2-ISO-50]|uniref:GDSL-type esterase/lipase family protein n=1 Tax=Novosphingobium sp. Fuku2-ISO-50 TaxID=1739114 RepID=UPI00076C1279|nr:GDSL-type esterase/lipase family protein [Novosphingobium sp. Fuku2-ISO-50]KUR75489.1 GDSL family lipase [Novosphingobium sp. Fuku2-ISO-50]